MALSITTTVRRLPLSLRRGASFYARAARLILGSTYSVSLVFIGNARSKTLNTTYRQKEKPTNVLAFPLSKKEGEICIAIPYALREARAFGLSPENHILYLFVHGALHLKGYDHGAAMERAEKRVLKKLNRPHPDTLA